MTLEFIDWAIIIAYLFLTFYIVYRLRESAGKSLGEFFLGGRKLPWYIAGISMVATTFAADTPLAVTELVVEKGISGNWLWWNFLIGGMLTTFFFSRLWRRANVLTEVEFINIRYGGVASRILRPFKAVYLGFFINILILGWVNLALKSLLEVFFDLNHIEAMVIVGALMLLVAIYASLSGLMGVVITDLVQFGIAMTGSIILAVLVLNSEQIGGISGLQEQLSSKSEVFNFFPTIEGANSIGGLKLFVIGFSSFFAYIGLQWWASWYPGAEPGGGGYVAQRMMSTKSEKDSIYATLFFQIAHYCIRPWPWILVALCSVVLYTLEFTPTDPEMVAAILKAKADGLTKAEMLQQIPILPEILTFNESLAKSIDFTFDPKLGYVFAMKDFLPAGLKGLLLVAFFAAYMSTISTQLNWGASYIVNDFIKPLKEKKGNNNEGFNFVTTGRIVTIVIMVFGFGGTFFMSSISGVWEFLVECGAGLGLVLILRWYWWRINVWSEIAATVSPFLIYGLLKLFGPEWISTFPNSYFITIGGTTIIWLLVTFLTPAESEETMTSFSERVRPQGFWGKYAIPGVNKGIGFQFLAWGGAVLFTYSILFGTGAFLFGQYDRMLLFFSTLVLGGLSLWYGMKKMDIK